MLFHSGENVTNDISKGLDISRESAEHVKNHKWDSHFLLTKK